MAKPQRKNKSRVLTPEEVVEFLDSGRRLLSEKDEPTVPVSIRIPGNILRMLKTKAKAENKKYQSLMVECLRKGLRGE